MSEPRLLVVEGNTAEGRARHVAVGGRAASDGYADLLRKLCPGARVDVCFPADMGANLPDRGGIEGYDGVAITGSALNIYDLGPAIMRQVELARAVFDAGVPFVASGIALWAIATFSITEERAHQVRLELEARRGAA